MFQSTRPRGARLTYTIVRQRITCFNPRAHVGRDFLLPSLDTHTVSFNPRAHVGRDAAWNR